MRESCRRSDIRILCNAQCNFLMDDDDDEKATSASTLR